MLGSSEIFLLLVLFIFLFDKKEAQQLIRLGRSFMGEKPLAYKKNCGSHLHSPCVFLKSHPSPFLPINR